MLRPLSCFGLFLIFVFQCWGPDRSVYAAEQKACAKYALLVPGFLSISKNKNPNTKLQYFSLTLQSMLRAGGYDVRVFKNLNPVGTIEWNGEQLRQYLLSLSAQLNLKQNNCSLSIIAHSAGGIYTAYALTRSPDLPISTVITLATPYQGAELADIIGELPVLNKIIQWIDLRSIQQLGRRQTIEMFNRLVIPQRVRWVALAAAQPECSLLDCHKAQRLSWLLSLTGHFIGTASDGVVSVSSALAMQTQLRSEFNEIKVIERRSDMIIPLEHWEVTLDADFFSALGVTNTSWIDLQQQKIAQRLLAILSFQSLNSR